MKTAPEENKVVEELVRPIARAFARMGGKAYLVGGCVRDRVLGLEPKDYDLEVYGVAPDRIEPALRRFGPVNAMGKSFCIHRVQSPRSGDVHVDVSIPRRDSKAGSGHKGFIVTGDPDLSVKEACRRRDVTINSILEDPLTGEILDPFGGMADIEKRVLRATDAELFGEDPLRVLRLCQFAARFECSIEPRTVEVCRSISGSLKELSRERVGEEWRKLLLKSRKPSIGISAVRDLGAAKVLHPELEALAGVPQEPEWHPEGDVWTHTLLAADCAAEIVRRDRFAEESALIILFGALCHDFGKPATTEKDPGTGRIRSKAHAEAGVGPSANFLRGLKVGEDIEKKVRRIVLEHLNPLYLYDHRDEIKPSTVKRLAVRLFPASFDELLAVAEADYFGRTLELSGYPAGEWLREQLKILELKSGGPSPILMGRHLVERGWDPGPEMGRVLKEVFELQIEGAIDDFDSALARAEKIRSSRSRTGS